MKHFSKFLTLAALALTTTVSAQLPTLNWRLNGNAGTTAANFLGTTDAAPLHFRISNTRAGSLLVYGTYIGYNAGPASASYLNGTAVGTFALTSNSGGIDNTAIGNRALYSNTSTSYNTAVGAYSLYSNSGNNAQYNTAVGYNCLYANNGQSNTAMGAEAMVSNTSGSRNTAMGADVMRLNTTGGYNAVFGFESLSRNSSGSSNAVVGAWAMYSNTTGSNNTAMGFDALRRNQDGSENTAIGVRSLWDHTNGAENTAIGSHALDGDVSGSYNTGIGSKTDTCSGNQTNSTAIGYGAVVNASNKVRLGNSGVTIVEGATYFTVSDGRFKSNIEENVKGLDFINRLRPVVYNFEAEKFQQHLMPGKGKPEDKGPDLKKAAQELHTGFIAQEMEKAMKESGYHFNGLHTPEHDGDNYSIAYGLLTVPLVKAVQELSQENQKLAEQNQEVLKQLELLKAEVAALKNDKTGNNSNAIELRSVNSLVLDQNVPNPFADKTLIRYNIPDHIGEAAIIFYDLTGKVIRNVPIHQRGAGELEVYTPDLSQGTYTYSLVTDPADDPDEIGQACGPEERAYALSPIWLICIDQKILITFAAKWGISSVG